MRIFASCIALISVLILGEVHARASGFAENLKPDQRVEVNIAGYKYQGTFKGYVRCSDGGKCATILAEDGGRTDTKLRFIHPSTTTAKAAPVAAGGNTSDQSSTGSPPGKYTCSFFAGTLQTVPGFTLSAGGKFTDHKGSGTWREAGGVIAFSGGAWSGQKAKRTGAGKLQVLKEDGSMGAVTCSLAKQ